MFHPIVRPGSVRLGSREILSLPHVGRNKDKPRMFGLLPPKFVIWDAILGRIKFPNTYDYVIVCVPCSVKSVLKT